MVNAVFHALAMSALMGWEILWALILGFFLSAIVQAVVSKERMTRLLPDARSRTLIKACGLGAASSSCSYAAVALTRSMFRKGANFTSAMAFQFASTNLVIELGVLLAVLMGWQFTLAEFVGGPLMIAIMVAIFRRFLKPQLVLLAQRQAELGIQGRMEGHAGMDMSMHGGSLRQRLISQAGRTAISHLFVMDWASVWMDIVGGLLISGCLSAWIPDKFWQMFFFTGHPLLARLWGPLIGPGVAVISFVCSVGNVPLAAVLWNSGISFGGVVSFIFADLIILPILNIYRKYYGWKMSAFLFVTFYLSMAGAALAVDLFFGAVRLIPTERSAPIATPAVSWDYTTWLNIVFLVLAGVLVWQFFRTGGVQMLRMMGSARHTEHGAHVQEHHQHSHHG
jgi:uncharacterized membrane protein YraQ (UPF0718 family)